MALSTVAQYAAAARILLQDTIAPYRYPDADLALALSLGLIEARRIRPDMFLGGAAVPTYTTVDSTTVSVDEQYRSAILYYIVGWAQLRDEEDTQDARASALLNKFVSQLLTTAA